MFGRKQVQFVDDSGMADSEEQEYRIGGLYLDNETKQFLYEQMQDQQRSAYRAEYDAEQRLYAERVNRYEQERLERAAMVKRNGGRWIQRADGSIIDGDGNIMSASYDGALGLDSL